MSPVTAIHKVKKNLSHLILQDWKLSMSSLQAQLAGIQANNNATILNKSKRKKIHSVSLIYEPREAAAQDFETIYYGALPAFRELEALDRRFSAFSRSLFSETSVRFDRSVQTLDQSQVLNKTVERFLMLVSGYLNLQPAVKALEWLVRRFHIHLENTESLILAALPYYQEDVFVRVLDIIPRFPVPFQFLQVPKQTLKGPSRNSLVRVLAKDEQALEVINNWTLESVQAGYAHSRLLVFWSTTLICVIMVFREAGNADIVDRILPLLAEVLPQQRRPQAQIAAYMVLAVVVSQFPLDDGVVDATVQTIANHSSEVRMHALACIAQLISYSSVSYQVVPLEFHWSKEEVAPLAREHRIGGFVVKWVLSVPMSESLDVIRETPLSEEQINIICSRVCARILKNGKADDPHENTALVEFVEWALDQGYPANTDALEVSLQSAIERPSTTQSVDTAFTTPEMEIEERTDKEKLDEPNILELSNHLNPPSRSFLAQEDPERYYLYTKAIISCPHEALDLVRVGDRKISFLLSVALANNPALSRIAAVDALSQFPEIDAVEFTPAVLTLLADPERRVRSAAAQVWQHLKPTKGNAKSDVWGPDTSLVHIGRSELSQAIKRASSRLKECALDADHFIILARHAGKAAWSDYLASHAISTPHPRVLWILLRILAQFRGVFRQLSPLYTDWDPKIWEKRCSPAKFPALSELEYALVNAIHTKDPKAIDFLIQALKSDNLSLAEAAGNRILALWPTEVLDQDAKKHLFSSMMDIAVDESIEYDPLGILNELPLDSTDLSLALENARLLKKGHTTPNEVPKRRRRSSGSLVRPGSGLAEHHLRKVTLLLEIVDAKVKKSLGPQPQKLFPSLFDIFEELVALGSDSNLPVLYTEELLANCMTQLVDVVKQNCDIKDLGAIRVNVIVSGIRTSTSPQVQNRLLLLVARLAELVPDLVLHSVMPIFTFMGANTVRLDNDFSAHVIQQTIEHVIPALAARDDKQEEVEMALISFSAAFPHIPRHRRHRLFSTLVRVLGPDDSLYKLLLLLGKRYADAKLQRRPAESVIQFSTTFLRSFPPETQLRTMVRYVQFVLKAEGSGLDELARSLQGDVGETRRALLLEFLELIVGNDQVASGIQPLRAQMRREGVTDDQLTLCAEMIELTQGHPSLLYIAAELLPIKRFVDAAAQLLPEGLEVVERKFGYELPDNEDAIDAADKILDLLSHHQGASTMDTMDSILEKFGKNLPQRELKLLDSLVGPYGLLSSDERDAVSAICCISTCCQHLGARVIGHFTRILPPLFDKSIHSGSMDIRLAAIALIDGLVQRIPSFMNATVPRILEVVWRANDVDINSKEELLSDIALKMDHRAVINGYVTTWEFALRSGLNTIQLFFASLGQIFEMVSKKEAAQVAPMIFDQLLPAALGTRTQALLNANDTNQVESLAASFGVKVVLKLNDKVFRGLFVHVVRWGLLSNPDDALRVIPTMKFVNKVLGSLKSIVTSYFGYIIDAVDTVIRGNNEQARNICLQSLILSFSSDQDDFWCSPARFDTISGTLLDLASKHPSNLLVKAVTRLAEACTPPQCRHRINEGLSSAIASDKSATERIWGVRTLSSIYSRLGEEWRDNLPQLVPLIAELLDDEDERVVSVANDGLVPVLEEVLGEPLDRYLS